MASDPQSVVVAVLKWRRTLQSETGAARAASARLRRASSVLDALMLEETLALIKAVRHAEPRAPSGDFEQRLVVLAMTLAHIETDAKTPLARALGQTAAGRSPADDERPRLSPARFGALVRSARARDWAGFARAARRALAILGDAPIDVAGLIRDVLFLNDATLRRWTYDYWQTRAPSDDETSQPASNEMETAP
jgi:CRISPR type I-E-associated protein CasB/Cse2